MRSVMSTVPRHERPRVRARARGLRRAAASAAGVSRRVRVRACVQVAAIAPELTGDRLSLLVRHALWSYWLDNRLDAPGVDLAAATRLRDGVAAAVTTGSGTGLADSLLVELAGLVRELSEYDPGGFLVRRYGESLQDVLAAEVAAIVAGPALTGGAPAPTAEQYLALAARTINYRSFAFALLAAGGDRLDGRQVRRIDATLRHASVAVRLANDARSLARDRRAGARNVLDLRTATGEVVTTRYVWAEVSRQVRAHDSALRALARRGLVPESSMRALSRCLARQVDLYQRTDVR